MEWNVNSYWTEWGLGTHACDDEMNNYWSSLWCQYYTEQDRLNWFHSKFGQIKMHAGSCTSKRNLQIFNHSVQATLRAYQIMQSKLTDVFDHMPHLNSLGFPLYCHHFVMLLQKKDGLVCTRAKHRKEEMLNEALHDLVFYIFFRYLI